MAQPFRIAIAGLGTVGAGTLKLIRENADVLATRSGRAVEVSAVSARNRNRDRGVDLSGLAWFDDPVRMAREAPADAVIELIGGADGPAKATVEAAIAAGRAVITANKALLAHHGAALARAAEAKGVALAFEASVAGGIPIVKALSEGLAGNRITRVYGILNGTCNYILTTMRKTGRAFEDVLADAQKLGYAEADPSFDIDGVDAAHKLAVLTALAFGCEPDFKSIHVEGIRHVAPLDIEYAAELGYRIKLLGHARMTEHGVEQRVHPCMVSLDAPIAHVEGVLNAVVAAGNFVGDTVFEGRGAGAGPTASAVAADIVDIARGRKGPAFAVPASALKRMPAAPMERHKGEYYVRLTVLDRPGVIADVAAALRDERISMAAMIQRGKSPDNVVPVVLMTHETEEAAMSRALARIGALDTSVKPPRMIRIEAL
jgi:homoserine dehydrogenase